MFARFFMAGALAFMGLLTYLGLELFFGSSQPVPHTVAAAVSDTMSVSDNSRATYNFCVKNPPVWRRTTAKTFATLCGCFAETVMDSVNKGYEMNAMRYAIDLASQTAGDAERYFPDAAIGRYADTADEAAAMVSKAASKCVGQVIDEEKAARAN
jgi:hypothetical protein